MLLLKSFWGSGDMLYFLKGLTLSTNTNPAWCLAQNTHLWPFKGLAFNSETEEPISGHFSFPYLLSLFPSFPCSSTQDLPTAHVCSFTLHFSYALQNALQAKPSYPANMCGTFVSTMCFVFPLHPNAVTKEHVSANWASHLNPEENTQPSKYIVLWNTYMDPEIFIQGNFSVAVHLYAIWVVKY